MYDAAWVFHNDQQTSLRHNTLGRKTSTRQPQALSAPPLVWIMPVPTGPRLDQLPVGPAKGLEPIHGILGALADTAAHSPLSPVRTSGTLRVD